MISKSHFFDVLKNPEKREYNIIFLGMSGAGKTHWSKIIAKKNGLKHIEFDQLIALSKEFSNLIKRIPGKNDTEKYLEIEKRFMLERFPRGVILDLTGSAIYHTFELERISRTGLIIYLKTSKESQKEMLQIYLHDPKPVCWKEMFQKNMDESDKEALARCYPILLEYREKLYERYADVTLPFEVHKNIKDAGMFVDEISNQLRD